MSHLVLRVFRDPTLLAARRLTEAGFDCYCPTLEIKRVNRHHRNGGTFIHQVPMFQGYFFLKRPNLLRRIAAPGVHVTPLAVDGRYLQLSDDDIARVKAEEAVLKAVQPDQPPPRQPRPGDTVTLLRGVLANTRGVVLSVRNSRLALVRLLVSGSKDVFVNLNDLARR